jgi:hypothetical protein
MESEDLSKPESESETKNESSPLLLQLGDIIEVNAPSNTDIHEIVGFVSYIDNHKINLIDIVTTRHYQLNIGENGFLTDESIVEIGILSRSDVVGYARQNALLPGTWIDIYFSGDAPLVITGEITNLEEDMIEITTYPERRVIFIDFEYKGLPETIPISKFVIRDKPVYLQGVSEEEGATTPSTISAEKEKASMEYTETGDSIIHIPENVHPDPDYREELYSMFIEADALVFGKKLEKIHQLVEVPEGEERYSIEAQVNDLLDALLTNLPTSQRTQKAMSQIHLLIERFQQLRDQFSVFDENQNVRDYRILGAQNKPLVERILKLDTKLQWLVPIVVTKKKIYDAPVESNDPDVIYKKAADSLVQLENLQTEYYEKKNRSRVMDYSALYNAIDSEMAPFENSDEKESGEVLYKHEVLASIDAIIDNLGEFYSTTFNGEAGGISRRKFVIQKYGLGLTRMASKEMKSGKNIYTRTNMTPNDEIAIRSLLMLPEPMIRYSKLFLSGTPIMSRVNLHQTPFYLSRLVSKGAEIATHKIEDLGKEVAYVDDSEKVKEGDVTFLQGLQEFVLSEEENVRDETTFHQFLEAVVPKTKILIQLVRKYMHDKLSFYHIIQYLEPFMVYSSDITYQQYQRIRSIIVDRIRKLKMNFKARANQFMLLRTAQYNFYKKPSAILAILQKRAEWRDRVMKLYQLSVPEEGRGVLSNQEILAKCFAADSGNLFLTLLSLDFVSLMTPLDMLNTIYPEKQSDTDYGEAEKIKAADCNRRFLAKHYTSLKDLDKDNQSEDVYYDEDLDDTPYSILKKYADQQKKILPEQFAEFLTEVLIEKHDCPADLAPELAATLIHGKKRVQTGEYAILEQKPKLNPNVNPDRLSEKERAAIDLEADVRKKIRYYKRVNNTWVHDDTIDESAFLDNNALFCNISEACYKNKTNQMCLPVDDAARRMKRIAEKRLLEEFDKRMNLSSQDLEKALQDSIVSLDQVLFRKKTIADIVAKKYSLLAYELGKRAVKMDAIQSPYLALRELILTQDDFVKKQQDTIMFVDQCCRDPMVLQLNDDQHWLYCLRTNAKLLPRFLYDLALTFVQGGDYALKQAEICHEIGVMSDDGDAIVDKHSGYVIRKIDFSTEEGYDEAGYRITTHALLEKDMGTVFLEKLTANTGVNGDNDRIFENPMNERAYIVLRTICKNIDIPVDAIYEFVLKHSQAVMDKAIKSEANYHKELAKRASEKKAKAPVPYEQYKNELTVLIIASAVFLAIQVAIPDFKPSRSFAGCFRSFRGYPVDGGMEDTSGLKYIGCVLNAVKTDEAPWNGIYNLNAPKITERIKIVIEKFFSNRDEIQQAITKKRDYIALHPVDEIVKEHSIQRWRGFMPPVVPFSLADSIRHIASGLEEELMTTLKQGKAQQYIHMNMLKSKLSQYAYAIVETVNSVVKEKELLLKTSSQIPFLENACCNDSDRSVRPLLYFAQQRSQIPEFLSASINIARITRMIQSISRGSILYDPANTSIHYPRIHSSGDFSQEIVYDTIIKYCNFDKGLPVPTILEGICNECPAGYDAGWNLDEKILFLKKNGKHFVAEDLQAAVVLINRENIIHVDSVVQRTHLDKIHEIIEALEQNNSEAINALMREHLRKVLSKYDPHMMLESSITNHEMDGLKEYLYGTNDALFRKIMDFFHRYGNLTNTEYTKLHDFLQNIHTWATDDSDLFSVTNYIKNAVYSITKIYPNMVLESVEHPSIPKHWGFSLADKLKMNEILKKHRAGLVPFLGDQVIVRLLSEIAPILTEVELLSRAVPIQSEIEKAGLHFYSIMDKKTTLALFNYLLYTTLDIYISATDDNDLLHIDIESKKTGRRERIRDRSDASTFIHAANAQDLPEDYNEPGNDLEEIQITAGQQLDLKERTCRLLVAVLDIEKKNKEVAQFSYTDIMAFTNRARDREKKNIIKHFEEMSKEERGVEDILKKNKLGKWNVGIQKGIVFYDEATNERETGEFLQRLMQDLDSGNMDAMTNIMMDVYSVPRGPDDNEEAGEETGHRLYSDMDDDRGFYDRGQYDIGGLGEDFHDGQYYNEDMDRDYED